MFNIDLEINYKGDFNIMFLDLFKLLKMFRRNITILHKVIL